MHPEQPSLSSLNAAPDAAGLVSGDRQLATADYETRIARAAAGFAAAGIGRGDCVAVLMRNDFAFLEASLAAQRLGAYAVPINWHLKQAEIAYILRDCGARVLVAHADLLPEALPAVPAGVLILAAATPPEVAAAYGLGPTPPAIAATIPDWDCWLASFAPHTGPVPPATQSMIYTSGTTGNPKGVRRQPPRAEQLPDLDASRKLVFNTHLGMRTLMPGPLYHSAPNTFALRASRMAATFVLTPRFEPEEFLALVERHRIDTLFMVPTMFVRLLKLPESVRRRHDVSSLSFVMHAAAPCPPEVKRAMIAWWGPVVWEFYGATESGAVTVISAAEWLAKPGSVGRPVPRASVRILDDAGRPLPAGEIGEVFTRIDYLPEFAYQNQAEKRREIERDGHITCGDVGYLDADGYLFLRDRRRDMVISGGVNIYPAEIESVLIGMPGVKDCAVFGIPDADMGERLLAVVEPMPGLALAADEVRAWLAERIAGYKVPRTIEFQADLPREDSGKIFKRRLRDPYWQAAGRQI